MDSDELSIKKLILRDKDNKYETFLNIYHNQILKISSYRIQLLDTDFQLLDFIDIRFNKRLYFLYERSSGILERFNLSGLDKFNWIKNTSVIKEITLGEIREIKLKKIV